MCLLMFLSVKADIIQQLVVYTTDGSKVAFDLEDLPRVKFSADNLIILSDKMEISYPLSSINYFDYEQIDPTGIERVESDAKDYKPFVITDDAIIVSQMTRDTDIMVTGMDGRVVVVGNVKAGETGRFPISHLFAGVYVVKIGSTAYKFVLK